MENYKQDQSLLNYQAFSPQTWDYDYDKIFGPFNRSILSPPLSGLSEELASLKPRLGMRMAGYTLGPQEGRSFFPPSATEAEKEDGEIIERRLHITNIPFQYREMDLERLFRPFGEVEAVQIIYNEIGSKGYGFVTMKTGEAAVRARDNINNAMVGGRIVVVNRAFPKTKMVKQSEELVTRCVCGGSAVSTLELIRAETKLAEAQYAVLSIKRQLRISEKND